MLQLAWDVKELGDLDECGRKLVSLKAKLIQANYDRVADNFLRQGVLQLHMFLL